MPNYDAYWKAGTNGELSYDFTSDSQERVRDIVYNDLIVNLIHYLFNHSTKVVTCENYRALNKRLNEGELSYLELRDLIDELWLDFCEHKHDDDVNTSALHSFLGRERANTHSLPVEPVRNHEFFHNFLSELNSSHVPMLITAVALSGALYNLAFLNNINAFSGEDFPLKGDLSAQKVHMERFERELKSARDPLTFTEELIAHGKLSEEELNEFSRIAHERSRTILGTYEETHSDVSNINESKKRIKVLLRTLDEIIVFAHLNWPVS